MNNDFFNSDELNEIAHLSREPNRDFRDRLMKSLFSSRKKRRRRFLFFDFILLGLVCCAFLSSGIGYIIIDCSRTAAKCELGYRQQCRHIRGLNNRYGRIENNNSGFMVNAQKELVGKTLNRSESSRIVEDKMFFAIPQTANFDTPPLNFSIDTLLLKGLKPDYKEVDLVNSITERGSGDQSRRFLLMLSTAASFGIKDRSTNLDNVYDHKHYCLETEILFGANFWKKGELFTGLGIHHYSSSYWYNIFEDENVPLTPGVPVSLGPHPKMVRNRVDYLSIPLRGVVHLLNKKNVLMNTQLGIDQLFLLKGKYDYVEKKESGLNQLIEGEALNRHRLSVKGSLCIRYALSDNTTVQSGLFYRYNVKPFLEVGDRKWNYHSFGLQASFLYNW